MKRSLAALSLAGALSLPVLAFAGTAPAPKDFVTSAIEGDNAEIMLGQLAQQKGASQALREFGETLAADHAMAKEELEGLAKTMQMMPPAQPKPEARKEYDRLTNLSGEAFDREFLKGMIEDHRKNIAAFQAEAEAKNSIASEFAAKQLPTLKKHLQIAEALQKSESPA